MFRQAVVLVVILCGLGPWTNFAICGNLSGRIVGGKSATDLDVPYIVSITSRGRHICGGSIINERTILTAAHCLIYSDWRTMKVRVDTKTQTSGGKLVPIESVRYHESFSSRTMDYDIGVMRLAEDLIFSDTVRPIAVPVADEDVPEGSIATVSGWGYQSMFGPTAQFLRYAQVPIINQATCNRLFQNAITDRMLCAGVLTGGIDACQMDSGGPLVVNSKLVGIVSWGVSCALPNKPGVYTRVSELIPWVADYLKEFGESLY